MRQISGLLEKTFLTQSNVEEAQRTAELKPNIQPFAVLSDFLCESLRLKDFIFRNKPDALIKQVLSASFSTGVEEIGSGK